MQTDTVGVKPGSTSKPLPGFDVQVLDVESGRPLEPDTMGMLAIKNPLPPGGLLTVYNNDERYLSAYMKTCVLGRRGG
jgi:propionyl-CoA synthetase